MPSYCNIFDLYDNPIVPPTYIDNNIDVLARDFVICIANAMGMPQPCTQPLM